jgi:hypothetical protein
MKKVCFKKKNNIIIIRLQTAILIQCHEIKGQRMPYLNYFMKSVIFSVKENIHYIYSLYKKSELTKENMCRLHSYFNLVGMLLPVNDCSVKAIRIIHYFNCFFTIWCI